LHRGTNTLALFAAWLLVLQALVTAWTTGAAAEPVVDVFGNPLCITSDGHDGAPAGDHSKLPDCHTFGCSIGSSVFAAPSAAAVAYWCPQVRKRIEVGFHQAPCRRVHHHNPGSPRAPPLTV
jgi:hypothetical protein